MPSPEPSQKKGHCPTCKDERNAFVRGRYDVEWHDNVDNADGVQGYYILQCAGCDAVYFQKDVHDSYDMERGQWNDEINEYEWSEKHRLTHYPAETRRSQPPWLIEVLGNDRVLYDLLQELYASLNAGLRVLAAIGIRTVLDRTSEFLQVDPSKTFEQKLSELVAFGKIGMHEKELLTSLVDAGSAAAHRGWSPRSEDLETMMDTVEAFLVRTFKLDPDMERIKKKIPPKPSRPRTATKKQDGR